MRLLSTIILTLLATTVFPQSKVSLWEGSGVRARSVTLETYLPANPTGTAVIVCPGGSYCWHDHDTEGTTVARWLQSNGIAAFVLNYRVQGVFDYIMHTRYILRGHRHPDQLNDIERAMTWVHNHADSMHIDPYKIGAMGFSAGGHLVMMLAEMHHDAVTRPAFVAPIYPVVTMSASVTHKRSRRALLGEYGKRRKVLRDSLSLEKHVTADCPPVFLVNCKDDPIVEYHNSMLLDSALTTHSIPHRYIQYATGGHGFGASDEKGTAECRQWRGEFINWIKENGF